MSCNTGALVARVTEFDAVVIDGERWFPLAVAFRLRDASHEVRPCQVHSRDDSFWKPIEIGGENA